MAQPDPQKRVCRSFSPPLNEQGNSANEERRRETTERYAVDGVPGGVGRAQTTRSRFSLNLAKQIQHASVPATRRGTDADALGLNVEQCRKRGIAANRAEPMVASALEAFIEKICHAVDGSEVVTSRFRSTAERGRLR